MHFFFSSISVNFVRVKGCAAWYLGIKVDVFIGFVSVLRTVITIFLTAGFCQIFCIEIFAKTLKVLLVIPQEK